MNFALSKAILVWPMALWYARLINVCEFESYSQQVIPKTKAGQLTSVLNQFFCCRITIFKAKYLKYFELNGHSQSTYILFEFLWCRHTSTTRYMQTYMLAIWLFNYHGGQHDGLQHGFFRELALFTSAYDSISKFFKHLLLLLPPLDANSSSCLP